MEALYPFFIAFIIVFLAELGDKTQILVISFVSKSKARNILLGVALGTFFSHGIAIIFGSSLGALENESFIWVLKIITYITFLIFGIIGFLPEKEEKENFSDNTKENFMKKLGKLSINYVFIIALSIIVGEIGDKTFLASMGLGVQYPNYKISLIVGAILGMVVSNSIAILFGKFINKKISSNYIRIFSNIIFILFGAIGLITLLI